MTNRKGIRYLIEINSATVTPEELEAAIQVLTDLKNSLQTKD